MLEILLNPEMGTIFAKNEGVSALSGVSPIYYSSRFFMELDSGDCSAGLIPKSHTRYFGKVQFLRLEHGYIRTRTKVNGLRDITFHYSSLPEELKTLLTQGTEVSFTLRDEEGGKFCADNIEIETQSSSVSSISSHSDESISAELPESTSFDDDKIHDKSTDKSSYVLSPAIMELQRRPVPSALNPMVSSKAIHTISLTERVDALLVQVISRRFSSFDNSCWNL